MLIEAINILRMEPQSCKTLFEGYLQFSDEISLAVSILRLSDIRANARSASFKLIGQRIVSFDAVSYIQNFDRKFG